MIEISHLKKSFGEKTLFDDYNLRVDDGEFLVIHGRSGAGKTTLLNMIGGLEDADAGSILVDGTDITRKKNRRAYYRDTVGFLFQNSYKIYSSSRFGYISFGTLMDSGQSMQFPLCEFLEFLLCCVA